MKSIECSASEYNLIEKINQYSDAIVLLGFAVTKISVSSASEKQVWSFILRIDYLIT